MAKEIHQTALDKGWYDTTRTKLEIHALIHSEIAEATEAVRNNKPAFYFEGQKPEGEAVELADAIIRILDTAYHMGWDIEEIIKAKMAYNRTRPYKHGGKLA
jgi:NTP pyrophosphatase (non-canonical NTP hydrolase)